jgi:TolA-binding protein
MLSSMPGQGFGGEVVTFVGRLLTMSRKQAAEIVARHGGVWEPDVTPRTTLVVAGAEAPGPAVANGADPEPDRRIRRAADRAQETGASPRIVSEDEFCERAGTLTPTALRTQHYPRSAIRGMYPAVGDEHLRYLEKWGLLRAVVRTPGETWFGFADLAVIKQASEELSRGASVKAILRAFTAERTGQLALDFQARSEPPSTRVVRLRARTGRPSIDDAPGPQTSATMDPEAAEALFVEASQLDTGEAASRPAAMAAYRRALLLAPQLVPALVNLGNLHYAEDHFPEAQALYVEAIIGDPDCFEAHFNLGNLLHDLGRFADAESCYREAIRIDPRFADAHFYLAVTLEKLRRSADARPHWKRYQELSPDGEWAELAKEFTD